MGQGRRDLQIAAVGITAAVAVELLAGGREDEECRARGVATRLLVAAGLAAAYGRLVPASTWGLRSGIAFAQLPLVASVQGRIAPAPPLRLAAWGALLGLTLRALHR